MKCYKILLWKYYFDRGFGLLSYVKYILAIVGVGAAIQGTALWKIFLISIIYFFICLVIGRLWVFYKLTDTEAEISNQFNPLFRDIRENLNKEKI